jgi:hypothetical protein
MFDTLIASLFVGRGLVVGMKVERKFSDFSAEKRKRNENVKMETEVCGTEAETEIF